MVCPARSAEPVSVGDLPAAAVPADASASGTAAVASVAAAAGSAAVEAADVAAGTVDVAAAVAAAAVVAEAAAVALGQAVVILIRVATAAQPLATSVVMLTAWLQSTVSCKHQMVDCWLWQTPELAGCLLLQQGLYQ